MPVDVDAVVVSNTQLSNDYNVLALAAPAVASQAQPGQFVMVKLCGGRAPLLRRPFSVFEVLRDAARRVTGFSLLNKRVGVTTRLLFGLKPGDRVRCLGPLGRPFSMTDPPEQAWMVAGGVGLAPFATLAQALRERDIETRLFYGGRSAVELFHLDEFRQLGVSVELATDDGSRGDHGNVTVPLARALGNADRTAPVRHLCLRTDPDDVHRRGVDGVLWPPDRGVAGTGDGLRSRRVLQLRRAGAVRQWPGPLRAFVSRRTGL